MMRSSTLVPLAAIALALLPASPRRALADAPTATRTFAYDIPDGDPPSAQESLAYVTAGAEGTTPVPLVVFLRAPGDATTHFRPARVGADLRTVADALVATGSVRPFVLVAPDGPRVASTFAAAWDDLDLEALVEATEAALGRGVRVDRRAVVVVRDAGIGCGLTEGPLVMLSSPLVADTGDAIVAATCPVVRRTASATTAVGGAAIVASVAHAGTPGAVSHELEPFFVDPRPSPGDHEAALERTLALALPKLLPTRP